MEDASATVDAQTGVAALGHQLVLVPGMGTDARLFGPQLEAFPELIVPPWLEPHGGESLAEYGARMARTVEVRERPFILGGCSLGGMVACEMAHHLHPDALALIASSRSDTGLWPLYRLGTPLVERLPVGFYRVARHPLRLAVCLLNGCTRAHWQLMRAIVRDMDPAFTRWATAAILRWRCAPPQAVPVYQIHGGRDLLLPAHRSQADVRIAGGGHLINLTHAAEVNAFLRRVIDESRARYRSA